VTSGKKVALSLLISILIFSAFALLSFVELFSVFETKFYQPAVISNMKNRLKEVSSCLDEYAMNKAKAFSSFMEMSCIKNSAILVQHEEDILVRKYFTSNFILENPGLQGVRLIDSSGKKIYFSTFENDESEYNKLLELPYDTVKANKEIENRHKSKVIFDNSKERIIFSLPFYDNYDLYRGSGLFYVEGTAFNQYLISKNILSVTEQAKLVATVLSASEQQTKGFILGLPYSYSETLISKIIDLWNEQSFDTQKILHSEDYDWFVISDNSGKTGTISLVFNDDILLFSTNAKILLLVCIFITLFLIILFLLNLKQDKESIIREKIKRFKFALLSEYVYKSDENSLKDISNFFLQHKHQINYDIKKMLGKQNEKNTTLIETLLEKTWSEVNQIIINRDTSDENKEIDNTSHPEKQPTVLSYEIIEELEPIDDGENLKDLDVVELDYVEELEPLEELESIEELEPVEDLEPIEEQESDKIVYSHHFDKNNTSAITDLAFEIEKPDFGILDEEDLSDEFDDENDNIDLVEEIDDIEEIESIEEIQETPEILEDERCVSQQDLEDVETIEVFSILPNSNWSLFSHPITEDLQDAENSIVESATGIFSIRDKIDTTDVKIDSEFKILVDSVLQNNV